MAGLYRQKETSELHPAAQFSKTLNGFDIIFKFLERCEVPPESIEMDFIPKLLYSMPNDSWLVMYAEGYRSGADPRHFFQVVDDYGFKSMYEDITEVPPF